MLEAILDADEVTAHERLRALELLGELDRRERSSAQPPAAPESMDDADWLGRVVEVAIESGLLESEVTRRVEARLADELRARLQADAADVHERAQDEPVQATSDDPDIAVGDRDEAASEPKSAARGVSSRSELATGPEPHPLDERAFAALANDDEPRSSLLARFMH